MAQEYSSKCNWGHNSNRVSEAKALGYAGNSVGENLYVTSGKSVVMADVVNAWYNEKKDYHYNTNNCNPGKVCGHYTQVHACYYVALPVLSRT